MKTGFRRHFLLKSTEPNAYKIEFSCDFVSLLILMSGFISFIRTLSLGTKDTDLELANCFLVDVKYFQAHKPCQSFLKTCPFAFGTKVSYLIH
jgi:hypothetical protein